MKEEKLFETIADINENYVADAHKKTNKKRTNSWMRWVAVAACLCLVVVSAVSIPRFMNNDSGSVLVGQLSDVGISAESIKNPQFVSQIETPQITSDSMVESIHNNLTVQGTLVSIDTAKIVDKDSIWYITTAEIKVDEIICGEYDSDTIHVAGAACYSGESLDANAVPITHMIGCEENTNGVFVLRKLDDGAWTMNGIDVSPKSLGDYYIVYYLDRSGDTLTYMQQNLSISLEDVAN